MFFCLITQCCTNYTKIKHIKSEWVISQPCKFMKLDILRMIHENLWNSRKITFSLFYHTFKSGLLLFLLYYYFLCCFCWDVANYLFALRWRKVTHLTGYFTFLTELPSSLISPGKFLFLQLFLKSLNVSRFKKNLNKFKVTLLVYFESKLANCMICVKALCIYALTVCMLPFWLLPFSICNWS